MLKARERSTRTNRTIKKIEAFLEDILGVDSSHVVDQSYDAGDEVNSMMAGLDDDLS